MKTRMFFSAMLAGLLLAGNVVASEPVSSTDGEKEVKLSVAPAKLVEALNKVDFSEGDVKIFLSVEAENRVIVYKLESTNPELTSSIKKELKGVKLDAKGYVPGRYCVNVRFVDASNPSYLIADR